MVITTNSDHISTLNIPLPMSLSTASHGFIGLTLKENKQDQY